MSANKTPDEKAGGRGTSKRMKTLSSAVDAADPEDHPLVSPSPKRRSPRDHNRVILSTQSQLHTSRMNAWFFDNDNNNKNWKIGKLLLRPVCQSPNIYTVDNFLTEPELKYLEEVIATDRKFQKSYVDNTAGKKTVIDNEQRTSTFISFDKSQPTQIMAIEQKAANLLACPITAFERLQLVRYLPGQFFGVHHDMGGYNEDTCVVDLPPKLLGAPRRLVTIFCYINDVSTENGGSTHFPYCKSANGSELRVQPHRGQAVVWSNVTKNGLPDHRTIHEGEALVVDNNNGIAVVKYGLNIWMCEER